jgi:hypothetical protein
MARCAHSGGRGPLASQMTTQTVYVRRTLHVCLASRPAVRRVGSIYQHNTNRDVILGATLQRVLQ